MSGSAAALAALAVGLWCTSSIGFVLGKKHCFF